MEGRRTTESAYSEGGRRGGAIVVVIGDMGQNYPAHVSDKGGTPAVFNHPAAKHTPPSLPPVTSVRAGGW